MSLCLPPVGDEVRFGLTCPLLGRASVVDGTDSAERLNLKDDALIVALQ